MARTTTCGASWTCTPPSRGPVVTGAPMRAEASSSEGRRSRRGAPRCPIDSGARDRSNCDATRTASFVGGWGAQARRRTALAASLSPMEKVLANPNWPEEFPLKASDFARFDENADRWFYNQPRIVKHIDDNAIRALTRYYASVFPPSGQKDTAILDICSSWISHYPKRYEAGKISGMGMNEVELKRNPVLTDWIVRDLNMNPVFPYDDNTYDVVTNAVSVDYLTRPLEVFDEIHRVLKPGGLAIMSFSNRYFPTKAIAAWVSSGDSEHIWITGSYFHYSAHGGFEAPVCKDISPKKGWFGIGDPMYVVYSRKKA
ncbi:unnamed protein product [Ostreobium quekettii]|uniref:Methyltransferase type 11 domain-containing protein n=1 Tax=Ostreobium quekettii TaxID=121088 RepID=A0A8S1IZ92_9CHLO|nr:unnamed protein product [Ostreobium quekettii]|eukprot:evm.model.scf_339EXC.6 EVM.evm.TU.scf_339EXC.6   scf_339EXC:32760-35146(+)